MKIKCFWEKEDVSSGLVIKNNGSKDKFMIISRGFSTGEPEFAIMDLSSGELTMNSFITRAAMATLLTQNDYEPAKKFSVDT